MDTDTVANDKQTKKEGRNNFCKLKLLPVATIEKFRNKFYLCYSANRAKGNYIPSC